VKLFQKNSNAYDHSPPTLQTDGQTDRQTTYHGNTALRYPSRGKKLPTDFDEVLWRAGVWPRDQSITFL